MIFSSTIFLCMFLPLVLLAYFLCAPAYRNIVLLVASLFFYAWGEPIYILIMLFSTVFDYCNGMLLEYFDRQHNEFMRKVVLIMSLVGNLGILGFFKYTDFFISNINDFLGTDIDLLGLALPIGISFYTFQTLSYTIDVYRRKVRTQHSILDFATYISMFPQLIAGPIVRYSDIEKEIHQRAVRLPLITHGVQRFCVGLAKKILLANQIGNLWDEISASGQITTSMAWIGAIAYTFQIYFDFSGYSDMAIGLGEIFGFHFPENFRYPYQSKSVTEFWRRWHITLSTWFKEYVYIPLGGNRKGYIRQVINLFIVWFLTGFWHGAGWNFIIWGLYYFVLLMLEKGFLLDKLKQLPGFVSHLYTILCFVIGWVIFASPDMGFAGHMFKAMLGFGATGASLGFYYWKTHIVLILICIIGSTSIPTKLAGGVLRTYVHDKRIRMIIRNAYGLILLLLSISFLVGDTYNPFLYFRF